MESNDHAIEHVIAGKVKDLDAPAKAWVVRLFGRTLEADDEVTVMVTPGRKPPSPQARQAAMQRIRELLDKTAQRMKDVPEGEFEAAVDKAMAHVRPRPN
ncbi:MAG: hypothetical protein WD278_13890 [Pirellulales bacterium]